LPKHDILLSRNIKFWIISLFL